MSDTKAKPVNLNVNAIPRDGYVLSVDGKLKSRFETAEDAMTAGLKLKQTYPVLQVAVLEGATQTYTAVTLPE